MTNEEQIEELKDALKSIYAKNVELVKAQKDMVEKNMRLEAAMAEFKDDIKQIKERLKHLI